MDPCPCTTAPTKGFDVPSMTLTSTCARAGHVKFSTTSTDPTVNCSTRAVSCCNGPAVALLASNCRGEVALGGTWRTYVPLPSEVADSPLKLTVVPDTGPDASDTTPDNVSSSTLAAAGVAAKRVPRKATIPPATASRWRAPRLPIGGRPRRWMAPEPALPLMAPVGAVAATCAASGPRSRTMARREPGQPTLKRTAAIGSDFTGPRSSPSDRAALPRSGNCCEPHHVSPGTWQPAAGGLLSARRSNRRAADAQIVVRRLSIGKEAHPKAWWGSVCSKQTASPPMARRRFGPRWP